MNGNECPAPRANTGRGAESESSSATSDRTIARSSSIDFHALNAAAIASLGPVLRRLAPGGKVIASEYVALNPRRADKHPGSFKVRFLGPRAGCWADFATGDKGGDPISLVAYLAGVSQGAAARLLARMLGIEPEGPRHD
jgi:hypothetical protein